MRRRFRRKFRPLWFPPLGTNFNPAQDVTVTTGLVTFELNIQGTAITNFELPLTFDFGQEAILADVTAGQIRTMADIMSSAWRVRRIIANVFAAYHPNNAGTFDPSQVSYGSAAFAAGFMVRKVNEFGTPTTNVGLLDRDDYDDPWVARRCWILGQDARYLAQQTWLGANGAIAGPRGLTHVPSTGAGGPLGTDEFSAFTRFPNTTAHYQGLYSGPFFDIKTNRVIGPEDRLIFHAACKGMPIQIPDPPPQETAKIIGVIDVRLLGGLMRSTNRRNASR